VIGPRDYGFPGAAMALNGSESMLTLTGRSANSSNSTGRHICFRRVFIICYFLIVTVDNTAIGEIKITRRCRQCEDNLRQYMTVDKLYNRIASTAMSTARVHHLLLTNIILAGLFPVTVSFIVVLRARYHNVLM